MNLVFLLQGREPGDQPGARDALAKLRQEGVLSACEIIPFYGYAAKHGWPNFWHHVAQTAAGIEADVIFFQFFHGPIQVTTADMQALRALPSHPTLVVTSGDPFGRFFKQIPDSLRLAASVADLTFLTCMGSTADRLERWGARNVLLMPHGYCQTRFQCVRQPLTQTPEFDVVFIGSRLRGRNFLSHHWRAARQRQQLVLALQKRYGSRFGLFGHNWQGCPSWQGATGYETQVEMYRRGRLAVGGYPHSSDDYYASDRPFIALLAGVPFLDHWVPRVDKILRDRDHWFLYRDESDLLRLCDTVLGMSDADRWQIAKRAAEHCAAGHSQYHRNKEMLQIAADIRESRRRKIPASPSKLSFFLPEVNQAEEWPFASRNWVG